MNTFDDRTIGEAREDARYEEYGNYDGPDAGEVFNSGIKKCPGCGSFETEEDAGGFYHHCGMCDCVF